MVRKARTEGKAKMSKSVFVTKSENDSFVLISYRNEKNHKLIGQMFITNDGKRYQIDIDLPKGKQNYGVKISTEDYYAALYEMTNFAAKHNLPYTDMNAIQIWKTRDYAWASAKVGA
jgi:hypothetical protein